MSEGAFLPAIYFSQRLINEPALIGSFDEAVDMLVAAKDGLSNDGGKDGQKLKEFRRFRLFVE